MLDIPNATDEELKEEIDGAQKYLEALLGGASLEGRETTKMAEVQNYIITCQAELDRRNANRT